MCSPIRVGPPGANGARRRAPTVRADHSLHWRSSCKLRHHKIRVDVETNYVAEQSDPRERRFVFTYTHHVAQRRARCRQSCCTRHWIITDADGKVQEVRGDGVVGEQPHLEAGPGVSAIRAAPMISTPVGSMQGSYQMVADDGERFDAPIPPFRLAMPGIVQ